MSLHRLAVLAALASCSTQHSTVGSPLEGKLAIESSNEREFIGSYESEFGTVKLEARGDSFYEQAAVAYVNDTRIDMYATNNGEKAHVGFHVHGGLLDERARLLLVAVHDELAERFPYPEEGMLDEHPQHLQLLRSYLGFLSEAPERMRDEVFDTRITRDDFYKIIKRAPPVDPVPTTPPAPPCTDIPDNDGITMLTQCCNGGTTVAYQHDDLPGGHCFMTLGATCGVISRDGCVGRCGPGCNANPGYYQDCVDHDMCLVHDNGGSGITPAGKCGDEWWEGADDFAFAYSFGASWAWLFAGQGPCN